MISRMISLGIASALVTVTAPVVLAQGTQQMTTSTPTAAAATGTAEQGSDLLKRAKGWIGYPVKSSDGTVVGTLQGISTASGTPMLVVSTDSGGQTNVPLKGSSEKGGEVVVPAPAEKVAQ